MLSDFSLSTCNLDTDEILSMSGNNVQENLHVSSNSIMEADLHEIAKPIDDGKECENSDVKLDGVGVHYINATTHCFLTEELSAYLKSTLTVQEAHKLTMEMAKAKRLSN